MRRRGISLIACLWFVAFLTTVTIASLAAVESARSRVMTHKYGQQAAAMADCGVAYAQGRIRAGRWKETTHFQSPLLDSNGWFVVNVSRAGGRWVIRSTGCAGSARVQEVTSL